VLCNDGKLFYYKSAEDSKTAKVPLDMNLVTSVNVVNGPLEFELRMGPRTLRLKATEPAERERWMGVLSAYLESHAEERAAAVASNRKRFLAQGVGIRDVDGFTSTQTHSRTSIQGWLHRQDTDMMRRWRKWWCSVEGDTLRCVLYESLRISDPPPRSSTRASARGPPARESLGPGWAGQAQPRSSSPPRLSAATSTSDGAGTRPSRSQSFSSPAAQPLPFRVVQTVSLPLATVTVREARQAALSFCFEAISPQGTLLLQALSQDEMHHWMQVMQNVTATMLGSMTRMSVCSLENTTLGLVRATPGNDFCADCGASDPTWASINLGVVVCLACAGIHRQLGVHISKVRSLELDTKEWSDGLVTVMTSLGNTLLNELWLARSGAAGADGGGREQAPPPSPSSPAARTELIRRKYEGREFVAAGPPQADEALHVAAASEDVPAVARWLALGRSVAAPAPAEGVGEWTEALAAAHRGRTALMVAAAEGSEGVLELLLQNIAVVEEVVDSEESTGRTPLRLAVDGEHAGCVMALLTRGANISHADHKGQTPMQAAIENGSDGLQEVMLAYKLAQDEKLLAQQVGTRD